MRSAPATEVVRIDAVLHTLSRGRDLINDAFRNEVCELENVRDQLGAEPTPREVRSMSEDREDLVEQRAAAIDEWENWRSFPHVESNVAYREHIDAQLARLRSLSRSELRVMDTLVRRFVWADDSPCFLDGGGLDVLALFERWLCTRSFWCEWCVEEYVAVGLEFRGRRRRFCSTACKQSAYRRRRLAQG